MFKLHSSLSLLLVCVACGSSFSSHEGGAGATGSAGEASGGQPSAGSSSGGDAGQPDVGGADPGGSAGSDTGSAGASAGSAGSGAAGSTGSAGSGGVDCVKLKQDYQAALEKARACDKGSTDQCSPSSTVEPLSCGCAVLVNARSEYTTVAKKARQAFRDAKCEDMSVCSAVACMLVNVASCAPSTGSAGGFVCTGAALTN